MEEGVLAMGRLSRKDKTLPHRESVDEILERIRKFFRKKSQEERVNVFHPLLSSTRTDIYARVQSSQTNNPPPFLLPGAHENKIMEETKNNPQKK